MSFFCACMSFSSFESVSSLDSLESGSTSFEGVFEGYKSFVNRPVCQRQREKTDLAVGGFRRSS